MIIYLASMLNSAVINGKVNLACDISPASQDDSVALILWYKDDSLAPIYTLDARKGKFHSISSPSSLQRIYRENIYIYILSFFFRHIKVY